MSISFQSTGLSLKTHVRSLAICRLRNGFCTVYCTMEVPMDYRDEAAGSGVVIADTSFRVNAPAARFGSYSG